MAQAALGQPQAGHPGDMAASHRQPQRTGIERLSPTGQG